MNDNETSFSEEETVVRPQTSEYSADNEVHVSGSCSTSTSTSTSRPSSIFDRLRVPPALSLARKRKIGVNPPPPKGKKRSSGQALKAAYVPKGITPSQRVSEFPGEQLVVSAGKLFCRAIVFSLLKTSFGEQQQSALHDLVTATLMVQNNTRKMS